MVKNTNFLITKKAVKRQPYINFHLFKLYCRIWINKDSLA